MTSPQQPPATLAIHRGAARTTISASPHLDRLAELRLIGRLPAVAVTGDTVRISHPWFGVPEPPHHRRRWGEPALGDRRGSTSSPPPRTTWWIGQLERRPRPGD